MRHREDQPGRADAQWRQAIGGISWKTEGEHAQRHGDPGLPARAQSFEPVIQQTDGQTAVGLLGGGASAVGGSVEAVLSAWRGLAQDDDRVADRTLAGGVGWSGQQPAARDQGGGPATIEVEC